jgi:hypothetical protein
MDIAQANIQAALAEEVPNFTGKDSGHALMQEKDSQPS